MNLISHTVYGNGFINYPINQMANNKYKTHEDLGDEPSMVLITAIFIKWNWFKIAILPRPQRVNTNVVICYWIHHCIEAMHFRTELWIVIQVGIIVDKELIN